MIVIFLKKKQVGGQLGQLDQLGQLGQLFRTKLPKTSGAI